MSSSSRRERKREREWERQREGWAAALLLRARRGLFPAAARRWEMRKPACGWGKKRGRAGEQSRGTRCAQGRYYSRSLLAPSRARAASSIISSAVLAYMKYWCYIPPWHRTRPRERASGNMLVFPLWRSRALFLFSCASKDSDFISHLPNLRFHASRRSSARE